MFLAISANENFEIKIMNLTTAFTQGSSWLQTYHGVYDVSKKWFKAIRAELIRNGMRTLSGDNAILYRNKEGKLDGMCGTQEEEFLISGSKDFHEEIERKMEERFMSWKTKIEMIEMTGLGAIQEEDGTCVDQNEHT